MTKQDSHCYSSEPSHIDRKNLSFQILFLDCLKVDFFSLQGYKGGQGPPGDVGDIGMLVSRCLISHDIYINIYELRKNTFL